jgi:hypothetical protein
MTFCCRNFLEDTNSCRKLEGECVPGRNGCVLAGEFKLSPALAEKISELDGGAKPAAAPNPGKA